MSAKEANRVPVIVAYCHKQVTGEQARVDLGLTVRQIQRLAKRYREEGVKGLVHRSRGQPSNRKIPETKIKLALQIIKDKYPDFKPTFAHEKLVEHHHITFSKETLRKAMIRAGLWEPKRKKYLTVHQARPRRSRRGELVQVDGSEHNWFEDRGARCSLLTYVDDADSSISYALFAPSESIFSYYGATRGYIETNGKPIAFYVDKHSVFRVNTRRAESAYLDDSNGLTQFGRAMQQLQIELIYAHSAEAKGRVERVFKTLQDRLVKEMRLRGISNIEEANAYLPEFIEQYNSKFAKPPKCREDAHKSLRAAENLAMIFTIQDTRVLSKNLEFQYKNVRYQLKTKRPPYAMRKATLLVREDAHGVVKVYYKGVEQSYSILLEQPLTHIADSKLLNPLVDQLVAAS